MIKQTCSKCSKDLPLKEKYFRKRANGAYRTDCRVCEAESRNERREKKKKEPVQQEPSEQTLGCTGNCCNDNCCDDTVAQSPEQLVKTMELKVNIKDHESLVNAIQSVLSLVDYMNEALRGSLDAAEQQSSEEAEDSDDTDKEKILFHNPNEDFFIAHDGTVYRAEKDSAHDVACSGCELDCNKNLHGFACGRDDRDDNEFVIWKKTDIPAEVIHRLRNIRTA